MKIRFLGQSGYVLNSGNTEIIIDPYLSDSVKRAAGRPRTLPIPINPEDINCDAVICTHNHLDHLDPDTVVRINENQFYITTNEGKAELKKLGRTNVKALNTGDSIAVGDFNITAVFADHTVEAFGLIVKAEGKTLYFSGDTLFAGTIGRTDQPGGDYDRLMESIFSRLMCLDGDIDVIPGHGPKTSIAEERVKNPFLQPFNLPEDDEESDDAEE